jgi:hypothetical protein
MKANRTVTKVAKRHATPKAQRKVFERMNLTSSIGFCRSAPFVATADADI